MPDIRLGLIGDNILQSSSPRFHELAGQQNGIVVQYDRLVPPEMGLQFEQVLSHCRNNGYHGVNVTFPYKERAAALVTVDDPLIRRVGAINTLLFTAQGTKGFNTDYLGFLGGYHTIRNDLEPGVVGIIGTGGVGRAIAFGLLELGASEIRLLDKDPQKAMVLASALRETGCTTKVVATDSYKTFATGLNGLVNATPIGMAEIPGTPLPRNFMAGAEWAFDAIYTPVETEFLCNAKSEKLQIISGYELFFHQGICAWNLFTGLQLDTAGLRADLKKIA